MFATGPFGKATVYTPSKMSASQERRQLKRSAAAWAPLLCLVVVGCGSDDASNEPFVAPPFQGSLFRPGQSDQSATEAQQSTPTANTPEGTTAGQPQDQPQSGTPTASPNVEGGEVTEGGPDVSELDSTPETPPANSGSEQPVETTPDAPVAPAPSDSLGRIGSENCPAGPFSSPVPATVVSNKLFSVGANNFFNFEGPVWVNDSLYFSEIGGGGNPPPSSINRYTPEGGLERGVLADTGTNGLALDAAGNLIGAAHDVGALSVFSLPGGTRSALGDQTFNGQRFNSPNDVVLRSDGNAYFTDPTFQAPGNPQGAQRVYRVSPDGNATIVDDNLNNPNGITLSLDESSLFVTTGSGFFQYALDSNGEAGERQQIQLQEQLQTPDGMAVDCAGNIYTTEHFARRIRVFDPLGNELDRFGGAELFDRDITNLAFGGPNRTTLFVTTLTQGDQGGVFAVELDVPGLPY